MDYTNNLRSLFIVITILIIGPICIYKVGAIDLHAIISTSFVLVPAVIVMGFLGHKIGFIMDNPKNKTDADYKLAVLNALKKMDKNMTLQELNEKLTKTVAEPDLPEEEENSEEDLDI